MPEPESVCVSQSAADERQIERVLSVLGIPYAVRLETREPTSPGKVCFQVMVYAVPPADAARARRALMAEGLGDQVVGSAPPA